MSGALRGVGLALVEVPRFRATLERRGERMLARPGVGGVLIVVFAIERLITSPTSRHGPDN